MIDFEKMTVAELFESVPKDGDEAMVLVYYDGTQGLCLLKGNPGRATEGIIQIVDKMEADGIPIRKVLLVNQVITNVPGTSMN